LGGVLPVALTSGDALLPLHWIAAQTLTATSVLLELRLPASMPPAPEHPEPCSLGNMPDVQGL